MRSKILASLALASTASAAYTLKDDLTYKNFFSAFDFFSGPDPTNGFVQYQTRDAAVKSNLVGYLNDTQSVFMGVDHSTKDPKGRASVRLESKKTWNHGLLLADIRHMPDSICGSWPAFWMLGMGKDGKAVWPSAGEIDILEGVNAETSNAVTLHTSSGCAIDKNNASQGSTAAGSPAFMGSITTPNCDVKAQGQGDNVGCSIKAPTNRGLATYGTDFNSAGGGVYATEWTPEGITVWFLPRNSTVTQKLASPSSNSTAPDPSSFGTPLARFSGTGCDYTKSFDSLKIIFNTAFCGDWAGKVWDEGGCAKKTGAKTCQEYVMNNPEAFKDAYWEVAGLRFYEGGSKGRRSVRRRY
ncbi:hypothetical protein CC80DRAFT_516284 [Byssothecium circinans]|uniref:endo-1,3(4)-beta-glucanase n=1 Tax=Byssothecium circinans TaxID=147558 RepID=A0A6A5TWT0_9PLEO|nr:hypothetical protein CC80DRAFT_516284 [Byssothecium circinans]